MKHQNNPRILIVDDETKNIQVLGTLLLQKKGYYINVAQNGREALKTVQKVIPDLILLDVVMPEPDGFEVCRQLKSSPETKDIPVIFLTAKSDTDDIVRGFELGAADYVTKPFNSAELLARVQTHMNLRMLQGRMERKNDDLTKMNQLLHQEITERQQAQEALRESEECFRILVEHGADPIFVQDFTGNILMVNKLACESLGYSKNELLCMNIRDIETDINDQIHEKEDISSDKPILIETRYIRKDGTTFPAEVRLVQLRLNREKVIVSFARDIQVRKQVEMERLRVSKLKSLATIAGGIAHDFNNLLYIISGYASMIEDHTESETNISGYLKEIEKAAFNAANLTHKINTFSKGGDLIKKTDSLLKLINDLVCSAEPVPGITYEVSLPQYLWLTEFDEIQMKQILKNLVVNAGEAMPDGGIISVTAANLALDKTELKSGIRLEAGKYVEICIRDHGVGISREHLSFIFDPYFSTKQRCNQKGMGLGLATAYSVIKKHNGYITVESEVSSGSAFTIYLPASEKK